jgi:hypothetical protein
VVDISPQGTALDQGRALDRIDRDGAHRRQVDHDPAVAHRGAAAAGNQPRSSVDGAVPYGSGVVVVVVVGDDHIAPEPRNLHRGWC